VGKVKFMSILGLQPGVNPDEALKFWSEKHISWAKDKMLPEAKRQVRNRVIYNFGEDGIFGIIEVWFDDMDSALRAINRLRSAPPDEFLTKYITAPKRILVEEEEI